MNQQFLMNFKPKELSLLTSFFTELNQNIALNKNDTKLINEDFEKAIIYYINQEKKLESILKILSPKNLGDCYKVQPSKWFPLDNAAKIYPLSMRENWMSVYRMSYYFDHEIVPEILQIALLFTMKRFPTFATSIRKGFFWNYIDVIKKRFHVLKDDNLPCSYINISRIGKQSFKVLYYRNRVSVEFFHILTDGAGGLKFLSTLAGEYLRLMGYKIEYQNLVLNPKEVIKSSELQDEFLNKKILTKKAGLIDGKAIQIDGHLAKVRPCQIIHFDLDLKKVHAFAKKYDATITELFLTYLFLVIGKSTSKEGPIKIQVPVNMRKYYPSNTIRNFSLYNNIVIKKSDTKTFEQVLALVQKQTKTKLNMEKLNEVLNYSNKLVKSLRFVPLVIKRPIANFIYGFIGDKSSTTVLSNIGVVDIPESLKKHLKSGDFVLGTTISNRVLFAIVTVGDVLTLSLTKFTTNQALEDNLYNIFKEHDFILKVHGSEVYGN